MLLIGSLVPSVSAQAKPCNLKLADLPAASELFGFRPGMTMNEVRARVPQVTFGPTDDFGSAKTSINPDFNPNIDKVRFAGVRTVSLDFLDGRLTSLWLGYDSSFKWQSVESFVKGISQSLELPNAWTSWKLRGRQLECADFRITLTMLGAGPSFRLVDRAAEDTLAARRQAKEEQESSAAENDAPNPQIVADKQRRVFYSEGCQPLKPIAEADRLIFINKEEAEKAGYRPAKDCH